MRNVRSDLSGHLAGLAVSKDFDYSFGAVRRADGYVSFRLWAPGATQVELEREGTAPEAMEAVGDGFYELRRMCAPGSRYWYRTGAEQKVTDPASRLQDGDVHDASVVVGPCTYDWLNTQWRGRPWTETVLYEIHVGLAGGFRGVQEKLAVWLT